MKDKVQRAQISKLKPNNRVPGRPGELRALGQWTAVCSPPRVANVQESNGRPYGERQWYSGGRWGTIEDGGGRQMTAPVMS